MIIFNLTELKMMSHRVMKHSVNIIRGKNDQWNTHLSVLKFECDFTFLLCGFADGREQLERPWWP